MEAGRGEEKGDFRAEDGGREYEERNCDALSRGPDLGVWVGEEICRGECCW